jgi:hypothetical protein
MPTNAIVLKFQKYPEQLVCCLGQIEVGDWQQESPCQFIGISQSFWPSNMESTPNLCGA